jgi:hypothetical protein
MSIPNLKDMITSWADEEDKANAKYDAICGKNKQNAGSGSCRCFRPATYYGEYPK